MPFCTNCGRQNPDDARFCSQCGTALVSPDEVGPAAEAPVDATATLNLGGGQEKAEASSDRALSPIDAAAVDALPVGHALLVVQRGPGAGNRFLLDLDLVTAGRHPESEIFLDDVTVSRRHAEFVRSGAEFSVRDVGSLNGTYVNRDRIDQVELKDGDEVQIGKYRLVFYSGHVNG
ncbi:MAG: FHA domain-containing protein [Nocardioides sp.]|uniref:FHA domain-containing protein n=1 Tax=Nocardioides sp. TaxID=35761 RepID=UPI0039E67A13